MEPGSNILSIVLLIALHSVVTLAYAALTNTRSSLLRDLAQTDGSPSPRLHITYQLTLLFIRFGIAGLSVLAIQTVMTDVSDNQRPLQIVLSAAVLLLVALATLVLGELVPEAIGSTRAEALGNWALRAMRLLMAVLNPVVTSIVVLSRWMAGWFGSSDKVNVFTEEEIMTLLDASEKEGEIENAEKEMIYSVLHFGDRLAREVMVPRIDVTGIEMDTTLDEALKVVVESGHSRLPVYQESIDHIKGLLYAKDLLNISPDKTSIAHLMRPAFYVPESKPADVLLKDFRHNKIHMAIVVDEYGGTAGIVTFEDLIEEIIGDVKDEYDQNEEADYVQQGPNVYVVDASMSLNDFNELLDVELPTEDSNTLGGFVFMQLGRVPVVGEMVEYEQIVVRVDTINRRRIGKLHVTRKLAPAANPEQAETSSRQAQPVAE